MQATRSKDTSGSGQDSSYGTSVNALAGQNSTHRSQLYAELVSPDDFDETGQYATYAGTESALGKAFNAINKIEAFQLAELI